MTDKDVSLLREALEKAARNYVRCAMPHSNLSPYVKENGLDGTKSPWTELCEAVAALSATAPKP